MKTKSILFASLLGAALTLQSCGNFKPGQRGNAVNTNSNSSCNAKACNQRVSGNVVSFETDSADGQAYNLTLTSGDGYYSETVAFQCNFGQCTSLYGSGFDAQVNQGSDSDTVVVNFGNLDLSGVRVQVL
ncbi:MAG: hypothetical protein ACPGJV_10695 [Bacteriovoracaceae bacterium]